MASSQISCLNKSRVYKDIISASTLERFTATFDKNLDLCDALPSLWHWCHFLPIDLQATLAEDGHPQRGSFLPEDKDLPQRMWAGSQIRFHNHAATGDVVVRTSTITDVKNKVGQSGALMFVKVKHDVHTDDGMLLRSEDQDIVYRPAAKLKITEKSTAEPIPVGKWQRSILPDTRLLFRFSAITFNTHRIHYDQSYACDKEGYPNLVVHGPLIALLLLDLAEEFQSNKKLSSFEFRAVSPLFLGERIFLNADFDECDSKINLWACNASGQLAMHASAEFSA